MSQFICFLSRHTTIESSRFNKPQTPAAWLSRRYFRSHMTLKRRGPFCVCRVELCRFPKSPKNVCSNTARDFLGFTAFESAVQTSGKEGVGVASDAYKRAVVEFTAVGPSPVCAWGTSVNRNPKKTSAVWRTPKSPPPKTTGN